MKPINFLTESEKDKFKKIKLQVRKCKTKKELENLEHRLDCLLANSIKRFKQQKKG